jgi:tetratricopeptide (TPR) repeat protein
MVAIAAIGFVTMNDSAETWREQAHAHKAAGRLEQAAHCLSQAGDHVVAAKLFEQLFMPEQATSAYLLGGMVVDAVRVAAATNDNLDELIARAVQDGQGEALRAVLQRSKRHVDVGHLDVSRGDHTAAIASYCNGERFDLAAEAAEQLGDARRAGQLWEQHLQRQADDRYAWVRLGRLLARFSQHDEAITLLQRGWVGDDVEHAGLAAPTMAMSFMRLGYRHAAGAVLARWLRIDPTAAVPGLDELMQSGRRLAGEAATDVGADVAALLLQGRYLLGQPLGGGGIGQVFRAHDAFRDEPVAVKIFGAEAMGSDAVRAYAQDVRAASLLRLPALARVIELNMEQGFIVSELLGEGARGRSLDAVMQHPDQGDSVIMAMNTVLSTLATCHRANLLHGGLKPQNVFVLDRGARLVDFGAHRLLSLRNTETGGLHTVWPYLSPELLRGEAVTIQADLYAVAAMLHVAWFGAPPFSSEHEDRRHAPRTLRDAADGEWLVFLRRALAPVAADRYADASAMLAAMPLWPTGRAVAAMQLPTTTTAPVVQIDHARYQRTALVHRGLDHRVELGQDTVVGRSVWIVAASDPKVLQPLVRCAGQWRGIQPVYDVLPNGSETWVVLAHDPPGAVSSAMALATWREVPQGLARDLLALAEALTALHDSGVAIGGFEAARAMGPVGIRMTLAPAPLPLPHRPDAAAADWVSFGRLVRGAFAVADDNDDDRIAVGRCLLDQRLVERDVMTSLVDLPWVGMLRGLVVALVANAEPRVVARVVADALEDVLAKSPQS